MQWHEQLIVNGWGLTTLDGFEEFATAYESRLIMDPRAPLKQHARDIIEYRAGDRHYAEAASVAHVDGTDDFSRMQVLDAGREAVEAILGLLPESDMLPSGRMSFDYFRYSPGIGTGLHQDAFGRWIAIWCLRREGTGGDSWLHTLDGHPVMRGALLPGDLLVFDDRRFLHAVQPMNEGVRDVLIAITLNL